MTTTVADFRTKFPAFANTTTYPDAAIQFWLDLSVNLMDAGRWGNLFDFGSYLFAAHNLSLEMLSTRDGGRGAQPGAIQGAQTAGSVDKVSWSRDAASAMLPGAGHWNLTTYGLRFKQLVNIVGAGGVYVGAPSAQEVNMSQGGWAGIWQSNYPNPS